ncbi:beta-glucosidase (plasmid) [Deinococcus psychrotolerans]|uniref:Beta-glucosidase n=1 Tax=Deinococcus psychrotolerans TaxID=2489213 RepID=A0A3G8YHY1_9DEIO|nr:GH1 family beta-glucosidase [Deinococcus psychrotolerans]AZI44862.1 beta-glucosidase [Deinococcus psychrotolerans]
MTLTLPDTTRLTRQNFPPDFVFGVATSSYQIEGAAHEGGRSPSIWDTFCATPGKVMNGENGDVACDHYHRLDSDLDLIASLNVNAYRFSVAWPRIIPGGRGATNQAGLDFYSRLVDGLLARDITPWLTLYHWDLPQVLQDKGGWPERDTALAFGDYAAVVAAELGDRVKHWITINEPWVAAFLGYGVGIHAPGHTDLAESFAASHHLLLAHGLGVQAVRASVPDAQVGITLNLGAAYPASSSPADEAAAHRQDGFANRWYLGPVFGRGYPQDTVDLLGAASPQAQGLVLPGDLEMISSPSDFLGVNMYSRSVVEDAPDNGDFLGVKQVKVEGSEYTGFDWEVAPQSLTDLMLRLQRDYNPAAIYITENGATYPDHVSPDGTVHDTARTRYFQQHLAALGAAITGGAKMAGYFAWSLMDNFEWAEGYDKRFGIVHVDFGTQARTLKASGKWYQDFLARTQQSKAT